MEIPVESPKVIADGSHIGVITRVEYRDDPFEYTDVFMETKDSNGDIVELKYGCPTKITKGTKLGQLLSKFGAELLTGQRIDPSKVLVGRKVTFMTMKKETDKGVFSNIIEGSVKPMEASA